MSAADGLRWFTGETGADELESNLGLLFRATRDRFALEDRLVGARGTVDYLATLKDREHAEQMLWSSQVLVSGLTEQLDTLNIQIAAIPGAVVNTKDSVK